MTTPTTAHPISRRDHMRKGWYLTKFSWAMQDYPSKENRRISKELRAQIDTAAADVGMDRALADLGHPYALAHSYRAEYGRCLPRWSTGAVAAGLAVGALVYLTMAYCIGALDALEAMGGGTVTLSVLGAPIEVVNTSEQLSVSWQLLTWPGLALYFAVAVLAFALGSRIWRLWRPGRPPAGF